MGVTRSIIIGVGAGIAAYKVADIVRTFIRQDIEVTVIPTVSSLKFVGASTWSALSEHPVHTSVFEAEQHGMNHVELARNADAVLVVPATADLLARMRIGQANDLLTATVLAAKCPLIIAPAMHSAMWDSQATQENLAILVSRGALVVGPDYGDLASGDSGAGRLAASGTITKTVTKAINSSSTQSIDSVQADSPKLLNSKKILLTAGGTREPIDPVRFLGNRSSGRQGCAIAAEAMKQGAQVTLIAANIESSLIPFGVTVVEVSTASEMYKAVHHHLTQDDYDSLVMTAAVADFTPAQVFEEKINKTDSHRKSLQLSLVPTRDILTSVIHSKRRPPLVVGFAAETGTLTRVKTAGREKAVRKGADLLAVNAVGDEQGFGDVNNCLYFFDAFGHEIGKAEGTKREVAILLISQMACRLANI